MKNTTNRGLMAGIYIKLLPLALLHGVILCLCGGSLEAQDCVNCTRGEIEMGGTFSDTLALNTDCRHTGGAGPPYDIIRYEQTETGCVTFTTSSTCDTMLELLDRDGCLAFIQNNDCATWEAEGLQGIQNSCLSLRLCPGIYYLCLYPMAPCEGWPDISAWEYSVRVSGCIEEPDLPANDSCSNAIPLELNTPVIGTTLHASCDAAPDCADDPRSGLAWYRFTGTGSEIELNTCNPATAIQARVAVYTGDCANLACAEVKRIGCLRDRETILLDTTQGVEYLVAVYGAGEPDVDSWMGEFELLVSGTPAGALVLPGDFNADSRVNISDPIAVLEFLFIGGRRIPCPETDGAFSTASLAVADFNGDARLDISDGVSMLNWLFLGGPAHHLGVPSECRTFEGCSEENICPVP